MRAVTVLAIIFGPLIVGALLPVAFGSALRGTVSESMVCDSLAHATKRGFMDAAARSKLLDLAVKTPNIDDKTRATFQGASKGC